MVKLKTKLFGRGATTFQVMAVTTSLIAGGLTVFQNFFRGSTLSTGIEQTVTKTPINFWTLVLGVLLIILAFMFIKRKK